MLDALREEITQRVSALEEAKRFLSVRYLADVKNSERPALQVSGKHREHSFADQLMREILKK